MGAACRRTRWAAFAAAVAAGVAIELDVRLSADGVPVVFHDERLERLTGVSGRVDDRTAAALRVLRLLGTNEHIPTLREALARVSGRTPVLVEVKGSGRQRRVAERSARVLACYRGAYAVQSFDPAILHRVKRLLPSVPCGLVGGAAELRGLPPRPDFIAYDQHGRSLDEARRLARSLGVPFLVWTARTRAERSRARRLGANVVFEEGDGARPNSLRS